MIRAPYIPGKTRSEIATPAPTGQRHEQAKKIIISLIGNGLSAEAVFAQVRSMYDPSYTNVEIAKQIQWATDQNFTPCASRSQYRQAIAPKIKTPPAVIDYGANITKFLAGDNTNEGDLYDAPRSWRSTGDWQRADTIMFLAGMFHAGEMVNIVTDYTVDDKGKANPKGWGLTLERDAMMRHIRDNGTPQDKAGAWFRFNPIDGIKANAKNANGTPAHGWTDTNVTAFRFILLEIDDAPLDLQISFFAKIPLPVNAIDLSAGKSCHALVRVDAPDAQSYRATVNEMFEVLAPFGICQNNKNPSRLSRLPGAHRIIGAPQDGDGQQRLIYLAPDRRDSNPIFKVNQ